MAFVYSISDGLETYCGCKLNTIIQISEPEEVRKAMCDVKRIELLISQVEKPQDVDIILIASANTLKNI